MRTRRKQIAIIIVITICMCNLQHSQRNPIYSEAVTSDFLYNEGDLIVPIWVDLSDKNVKTTGKNLIVESPPVFSDISLAKYYSSVKFYYSIKVKDEKEQEKADKHNTLTDADVRRILRDEFVSAGGFMKDNDFSLRNNRSL